MALRRWPGPYLACALSQPPSYMKKLRSCTGHILEIFRADSSCPCPCHCPASRGRRGTGQVTSWGNEKPQDWTGGIESFPQPPGSLAQRQPLGVLRGLHLCAIGGTWGCMCVCAICWLRSILSPTPMDCLHCGSPGPQLILIDITEETN